MITKRDTLKSALIPDWPRSALKEENGSAINAEAAGRLIGNKKLDLLDCKIRAVGFNVSSGTVVHYCNMVATARSFGRIHFVFDLEIPRDRLILTTWNRPVTFDWPPPPEMTTLEYLELIDDRGIYVHSYHLAHGCIKVVPGTKLTSSINILFDPVDYGFSRY